MLILNVVKVLCFDTLLQVLILKVVKVAGSVHLQPVVKCDAFEVPQEAPPRSSGQAAQAGQAPQGSGVNKGCHTEYAPPTRVFWEKRLQAVENKERELQKEAQEAARD